MIQLAVLAAVGLASISRAADPAAATVAGSGAQTILLVDDHEVLYRAGTRRVLHQPVRHPANPLIVGPEPRNQFGYCSVYRNPATGRYQMWYQLAGSDCVVCYAESEDGVKWAQPALGLLERKGIPARNIVFASDNHYGASVVVDPPGGDPARRFKMVYWSIPRFAGPYAHPADHRGPDGGMYVAFSPDGIHWTKFPGVRLRGSYGRAGDPPLADGPKYPWGQLNSVSDVLDATFDPIRRRYVVHAKGWIDAPDGKLFWKRSIMRTESPDFVNWSSPQLIMAPDEHDGVRPQEFGGTRRGVQLHGAPMFLHHGVYFALVQVADFETDGLQPIELAISHDGLTWSRPFRGTPFIPVGSKADFDAGRIWSNATPIVVGDEMRFYYGAYQHPWQFGQKPNPWDSKTNVPKSGLGLAVLPLDRFAGVRPIEKIGQITLKARPFRAGASLTVNADAAGGTLRVELLSESGLRVRGHTKSDARPISGEGLRHRVSWKNAAADALPAGSYMIRLHLDNCEVYALTLE